MLCRAPPSFSGQAIKVDGHGGCRLWSRHSLTEVGPSASVQNMLRSRIEMTLAAISLVLTVASLIWPTWIESLSGLEPDGGTGETERWLAFVFAAAAVALFLLSRRDRRIALGRPSAVEPG